jgi:hypothetical protein
MVEEKKDEMVQPLALKLRVANGIASASARATVPWVARIGESAP